MLPHLRVLGCHLGAGPRAARGFGGAERPGQPFERYPGPPQQIRLRDLDGVAVDRTDPTTGIEVLLRLDGHAALVCLKERDVVAHADQEKLGELGTEHEPGRSREPSVCTELEIPTEPDRSHQRAIRQPGQEGAARGFAAVQGEQCCGECRGQEGTGAIAKPSSSRTIESSGSPKPWPPRASST